MKVTTETLPTVQDRPCTEMRDLFVGILTSVPPGVASAIGDPVIRVIERLYFPKLGTWAGVSSNYRFRPLQPGERIIFEG